jgi:hypothetical protein
LCSGEFLLSEHKIEDSCFEGGGPYLSSLTAPAEYDGTVITFTGVIPWGEAGAKPMNVQVFLKTVLQSRKKIG